MDIFRALGSLPPLMRVGFVVGVPLLVLVVASNPTIVQNIVHILQVIPPIIYTPIYVTAKKSETQPLVVPGQGEKSQP